MSRESLLDKSLDEIIGDSRPSRGSFRGSRGSRRGHRGVSKPSRGSRRGGGFSRSRGGADSYIPRDLPHVSKEIEELSNGNPYLRITNLNVELTEQDIGQLFSQIGEIAFCRVEIDTQGNSKGVAYVGFVDTSNNELAIEKFDGRRAAGQVITVKDMSKTTATNPLFERISLKNTRREATHKHKKKTAEELDAELDSYFTEDTDSKQNGDPNPPFAAVI